MIDVLKRLAETEYEERLAASRFRNQTDFYSLFAAIASLLEEGHSSLVGHGVVKRLVDFAKEVDASPKKGKPFKYSDAVRSHSNDTVPRTTRINIVKDLIRGK